MNKDELKKMLNAVYEMEGLIELALRRNMTDNDSICRMIADKSFTMANMAAEWNLAEEVTNESEDIQSEDDKIVDVFVENCLPEINTDEQEDENDNETEVEQSEIENPETENLIEEIEDDDSSAMCEPEVTESESEEETTEEDSFIEVITEDIQPEENEFDDIKNSTLFDDDDFVDITHDDDDENDDDAEFENDDENDEIISVDTEKLPERKDIRSFFTVNDKFRFKRELFGNNNIEFTESLNLVQTMRTFDEAEDYFYNDLQWDSESEDVMEFMSIIARFFK